MSASRISSGFVASNFRSAKFAATGEPRFESVVLTRDFRSEIARIRSPFMIFATVFREHTRHRATSFLCIRGEP